MIQYFSRHRDKLPMLSVGLAMVALLLVVLIVTNTSAYAVHIDEQVKLVVDSTDIVDQAKQEIEAELKQEYGENLEICSKIKYTKTWVMPGKVTPEEKIQEVLMNELDIKRIAAAISVDGETIAYMKTEKEAQEVLEEFKNQYTCLDENEKLLEVGFAEQVEIKQTLVDREELVSKEEMRTLISTGTLAPHTYVVEEGDSLWQIARKNNIYVDDIIKANCLKTEKLSLGQELVLEKSQPYLNVMAKVEGKKTEDIPYQTQVVVDSSSSRVRVTQDGEEGKKQIAYVATLINGVVQDREVMGEDIIKEPVDKIIIKGSGIVQVASRSGAGSGALDWPVYGSITQYYRSGHLAIDIANSRGTAIKAADSGYVTYAGYQGGYGNFIIVDHGNGLVTRYAHCDSFAASVGQKVAKGQTIAALGNTGRSTGPHLHFEVQSNGSFQNPLNYLR
ncbi:MAG: peptidoglycan DD-metalloendopeptidase family protein [Syntrophomonadaceae bacterium]|jgi:murein DD-endopeptidase MepM/ murein hydrolase activator NlpD|nr:peptidoglycan DD-metalloendopeptidase family protein [Syntrophomonadaceae bacterium]